MFSFGGGVTGWGGGIIEEGFTSTSLEVGGSIEVG